MYICVLSFRTVEVLTKCMRNPVLSQFFKVITALHVCEYLFCMCIFHVYYYIHMRRFVSIAMVVYVVHIYFILLQNKFWMAKIMQKFHA